MGRKKLADWLNTPLTTRQLDQVDFGISLYTDLSLKEQRSLYQAFSRIVRNEPLSSKEKKFLRTTLAETNGKVSSFMGFIHQLMDSFDASIYHTEYTKMYKVVFQKGISIHAAGQMTSHFETYEDDNILPDLPPLETDPLDTFRVEIEQKLSTLAESIETLAGKIVGHHDNSVVFQRQITELQDQINELEQSNIDTFVHSEENTVNVDYSLKNIYENLPPNTHITITINKGE